MTKNFYSIKLIIKGMKGACKMAEQILFGKCVAEGSGYDVGRGYAEQLRLNGLLREINLVAEDREVTGEALRERQRLLYAVCPGIELSLIHIYGSTAVFSVVWKDASGNKVAPFAANASSVDAVSYTHLDVYKRQITTYFGD